MVRIAREVGELAPGDASIADLHTEYCAQARVFWEAAAQASVRDIMDASEDDFMELCRELSKQASLADAEDTVRLGDADHDLASLAFAADVSARAGAAAPGDGPSGEPSLEDAWSLLAARLLHVVDERIGALRVELREEMDARIAIPDYVHKPGE